MANDITLRDAAPSVTRVSGMCDIFNFVPVESVESSDEAWSMHWSPRSEQTIALCGKNTMPSNINAESWGKGEMVWCEECNAIKQRVLPTR